MTVVFLFEFEKRVRKTLFAELFTFPLLFLDKSKIFPGNIFLAQAKAFALLIINFLFISSIFH
jgi:hypothetical protein